MPCRKRHHVYAGTTWLDPDVRLDMHKAGIEANRFDETVDREIEVAIDLLSARFGM